MKIIEGEIMKEVGRTDFLSDKVFGEAMAKEGAKVTMTEVGRYPEFVLGELADVPAVVESTGFGRQVAVMRAKARAAGLTEAEVEKISTCPLVRLLVKGN